jgi:hypothetical protein
MPTLKVMVSLVTVFEPRVSMQIYIEKYGAITLAVFEVCALNAA